MAQLTSKCLFEQQIKFVCLFVCENTTLFLIFLPDTVEVHYWVINYSHFCNVLTFPGNGVGLVILPLSTEIENLQILFSFVQKLHLIKFFEQQKLKLSLGR